MIPLGNDGFKLINFWIRSTISPKIENTHITPATSYALNVGKSMQVKGMVIDAIAKYCSFVVAEPLVMKN